MVLFLSNPNRQPLKPHGIILLAARAGSTAPPHGSQTKRRIGNMDRALQPCLAGCLALPSAARGIASATWPAIAGVAVILGLVCPATRRDRDAMPRTRGTATSRPASYRGPRATSWARWAPRIAGRRRARSAARVASAPVLPTRRRRIVTFSRAGLKDLIVSFFEGNYRLATSLCQLIETKWKAIPSFFNSCFEVILSDRTPCISDTVLSSVASAASGVKPVEGWTRYFDSPLISSPSCLIWSGIWLKLLGCFSARTLLGHGLVVTGTNRGSTCWLLKKSNFNTTQT